MYIPVNSRKLCVLSRKGKLLFIDIKALYRNFFFQVDFRRLALPYFIDNRPIDALPLLKIKFSVYPRRYVFGNQTRLYRDSSRSAKHVRKRSRRIPYREFYHCGGKRFFKRRLADKPSIASPVKSVARSVQSKSYVVFIYCGFYLISFAAFGHFQ